ncbi:beta-1,3-galactosyltransferase GALT1 [Cryptomeria japonica]|uniref:beta-1,3-galactosyltransferase GALT1 n=1 Tax=Cryptomeria japonica TaxID=3369 RepID=UPI0027DAAB50|nr:beta-1,3-galactosyltransferase GALT1 [Cryptomeria japonica]XP_057853397.2 beta-1,3-galactosyltransferase GALT1 [Cryptomeria japonica]XP_057853399.2 beta-1,3-galactosyltransferase GALT1 [Cryptomeria japonica]
MKIATVGVTGMKKWFGSILIVFLIGVLVLRYHFMESVARKSSPFSFFTDHMPEALHLERDLLIRSTQPPESISQLEMPSVTDAETLHGLFSQGNLTKEEIQIKLTWNDMKKLVFRTDLLPEARVGVKEAVVAWQDLMQSIEQDKLSEGVKSINVKNGSKEKQCPFSLSAMNATNHQTSIFFLQIPCGFVQDSSITIVGIPSGLLGKFQIELTGAQLPGEPNPPIVLHYNVRLQGDKITEDPVIVQNTWSVIHDWGEEERCPYNVPDSRPKVDGLSRCNERIGEAAMEKHRDEKEPQIVKLSSITRKGSRPNFWFPFVEGYPFAATLWVGLEGFHMTVNGKHITSFEYRESLEPWLVSGVRIAGDLQLLSVLANGLPTSEDLDLVVDLESLKAPALTPKKKLAMFIGVFSTGNNFERRMAVRRSWMQYRPVRSGQVAVRFFVGMHKNKQVNEELWKEARTYGDIQLMPFVDYYNLITLKTIAICIYGTKVVQAKYIMKTDDDAFVRVDAVLSALNETKVTRGLLYGRISFDSQPHRSEESKWYISPEEWPHDFYPPWAHGPGYIISRDIAKFVVRSHQEKQLKLFKLEDVAMGIWIEEFKKRGHKIQYINDERFFNTGCEPDYILAHYQGPRTMLCLWQKLQQSPDPVCCE